MKNGDVVYVDAVARIRIARVRRVMRKNAEVAWTKADGGVRVSRIPIEQCFDSEQALREAYLADDRPGRAEAITLASFEPPEF